MPKLHTHEPPQVSLQAPEGNLGSLLHDVYPTLVNKHSHTEQHMRYVNRLLPPQPERIYIVGRTFALTSSQYRAFLQHWLGKEQMQEIVEEKKNPRDLIGMGADLEIHHVWNPGHPKPFCSNSAAHPRGSMELNK